MANKKLYAYSFKDGRFPQGTLLTFDGRVVYDQNGLEIARRGFSSFPLSVFLSGIRPLCFWSETKTAAKSRYIYGYSNGVFYRYDRETFHLARSTKTDGVFNEGKFSDPDFLSIFSSRWYAKFDQALRLFERERAKAAKAKAKAKAKAAAKAAKAKAKSRQKSAKSTKTKPKSKPKQQ